MTKEQYEGTPELIFYCEYNPNDFEDRLEIPFTNDYDIKLDFSRDEEIKEIHINVDLQPKESNIPKDFFGKNILNVTAIAGKNGVGKTKLLEKLVFNDKKDDMLHFLLFIDENTNQIYFMDHKKAIFYQNKVENKYLLTVSYLSNKNKITELDVAHSNLLIDSENQISPVMKNYTENINQPVTNIMRWSLIQSESLSKYFNLNINKSFSINLSFPNIDVTGEGKISLCLKRLKEQQNRYNYTYYLSDKKKYTKELFILLFLQVFYTHLLQYLLKYISNQEEAIGDVGSNIYDSKYSLEQESLSDDEYKEYQAEIDKDIKIFKYHQRFLSRFTESISRVVLPENDDYQYIENIKDLYKVIEKVIRLIDKQCNHDSVYASHYHKYLSNIYHILQKVPDDFFCSDTAKINILDGAGRRAYDNDFIVDLLHQIDLGNQFLDIKDILICEFENFSSGEMQLIDTLALLYSEINRPIGMLGGILFDEPDSRLHPEWSRKYLSYLLKFLDTEGEQLGIKFQVVLTTHSPYLISDLPKENIILLEKDEITGKRTARKSNFGFASNYYDIMSDSFFLDDTIGEFAKQKINGWLKEIQDIRSSKGNFENKNKKLDQLKENLSIIGDEFLRNELMKQINIVKDNVFNEISNEDKIAFHRKQIAELERKGYHD